MKNNILKNRRFKHGTLATVMTVIFVAAVVLVNVIATILLNRFPLNIDLTKNSGYALAADTKDFLKGIDREVKIHIMMDEASLTVGSDFYTSQVKSVFTQVQQYSGSKVKVDYVDLTKNPQYSTKYSDENIAQGSVIIESDLRYRVLNLSQFLDYTYAEDDYYGQNPIPTGSHAELDIMSALMYVTDENPTKVVQLTGFSETEIPGLSSLLQANNYAVESVNLMTNDIPEDTDVVFIPAPTRDYTQAAIDKVEKFLNNSGKDGKNLVYIASSNDQKDLPILEGYLESEWGIQVEEGVIWETNPENIVMTTDSYAFSFIQTLTGNMFTEEMSNISSPVYMYGTRPITAKFASQGNLSLTTLIKTADTCVLQPMDANETGWTPEKATKQSFSSAVASIRDTNKDNVGSTVVAFGSTFFFDEMLMKQSTWLNGEYTLEIFNNLAGKEEVALKIVPKTSSTEALDINASTINTIMIVFMIIVPIAVFAAGLIIWFRRRNR